MKQTQLEKHFLNLAGEYGVCAELAKYEILGSITYGMHKAADIIVVNPENKKSFVIEVKTTKSNKIVTGFFQKYKTKETIHPDFWVIVHIDNENKSFFYVLTHNEVASIQMKANGMKEWKEIIGVDNVKIEPFLEHENKWEKIVEVLK